jgi:hypothetical protein
VAEQYLAALCARDWSTATTLGCGEEQVCEQYFDLNGRTFPRWKGAAG